MPANAAVSFVEADARLWIPLIDRTAFFFFIWSLIFYLYQSWSCIKMTRLCNADND
jgi:hypothetical protein